MRIETDDFGVLRVYPFGKESFACMLKYREQIKVNLSLNEWYTEKQLKELIGQLNDGLEMI
jgi:hypothetical protein